MHSKLAIFMTRAVEPFIPECKIEHKAANSEYHPSSGEEGKDYCH